MDSEAFVSDTAILYLATGVKIIIRFLLIYDQSVATRQPRN